MFNSNTLELSLGFPDDLVLYKQPSTVLDVLDDLVQYELHHVAMVPYPDKPEMFNLTSWAMEGARMEDIRPISGGQK
jgi:hypothetical protein